MVKTMQDLENKCQVLLQICCVRWVRPSPSYVPQFLSLQSKSAASAQVPEAQPAHAVMGDPGASRAWDCRDHCWGSTEVRCCWQHGAKSVRSPPGYVERQEHRSPFLIPYTNSQKYIFSFAHMSSYTKPFPPFGAFLLYSCPEYY